MSLIVGQTSKGNPIFLPESDQEVDEIDKMISRFHPMNPKVFARKALKLVAKNRPIIVLPGMFKRFWFLNRMSPSLFLFLSRKRNEKLEKLKKSIEKD